MSRTTEPTELEARIADLERRVPRAASAARAWRPPSGRSCANLFPGETRKHMKAAGREQLLAARSYLDHWIAKMDEAHAEEKPAPRESIEVE